jgi:hypothetical protein
VGERVNRRLGFVPSPELVGHVAAGTAVIERADRDVISFYLTTQAFRTSEVRVLLKQGLGEKLHATTSKTFHVAIPIERHLLVRAFASDPSRMLFDAETYERFRTERRAEIWRLLLAAMGASASV